MIRLKRFYVNNVKRKLEYKFFKFFEFFYQ